MFGNKRNKFLPYGRQLLAGTEYRAVRRVLKSPFLTQGPCVERFEEALRKLTGAPYAVAVANGTMALDLAVRAVKMQCGLKEGALALTTPNTFVASSNALLYNQLTPLFCDISPETYNLSLSKAERLLARHNGEDSDSQKPIELLLPVHFAGEPLDMARLSRLAQEYASETKAGKQAGPDAPGTANVSLNRTDENDGTRAAETVSGQMSEGAPQSKRPLPIIEDAAHALGSYYAEGDWHKGKAGAEGANAVGSCVYSDACCFSFHPVKTVTTGEGGAITCRDPQLHEILLLLRNHGIARDPEFWLNAAENCEGVDLNLPGRTETPMWYYEMQALGYNARLSDIHAAVGIEQLRRLRGFSRRRRDLALRYDRAFRDVSWMRVPQISGTACLHLYVVQIDFAYLRLSRNAVMRELRAQGIGSQVHYIPIPMQPFYRHLGYNMAGLENTWNYYGGALSLPLYPGLRLGEQERVIRAVCRLAEL
ncbi:DegT/DnrJ/EryC1/StrS family aminotransferase [Candidatus Haliotispira prima]|uniref:DegT/DnrJ/EryC1/StrS family aminotransferase n=1 Tax=Candidatus Haliotispira prima TaxID=3034016 RepID=A0ABY8MFP6_9SPIO|nr:DegT/DnrJ/EryC1/StrS family aminotransferase [Candidatus Haliotispira prima]